MKEQKIEKKVINKGTNALIVREFMEESTKMQTVWLPGKTIFFCMRAKRMQGEWKKFLILFILNTEESCKGIGKRRPARL